MTKLRDLTPEDKEIESQDMQENFSSTKYQDNLWALTQSLAQWDTKGLSPGLKDQGQEADESSPFSANVFIQYPPFPWFDF